MKIEISKIFKRNAFNPFRKQTEERGQDYITNLQELPMVEINKFGIEGLRIILASILALLKLCKDVFSDGVQMTDAFAIPSFFKELYTMATNMKEAMIKIIMIETARIASMLKTYPNFIFSFFIQSLYFLHFHSIFHKPGLLNLRLCH